MSNNVEKILLVESDPDISDLIARQALQPAGYAVEVVNDAGHAIQRAVSQAPDLIIADINLSDLSGKDLIVALSSQGIETPLIVIASEGEEEAIIQAFRLGATDYLLWPAREAEVVAAVERALKQVRESRARQRLDRQLKEANQELQRRVRELTTLFAVGKAVISITDQRLLFDKIVEGMVHVAEADFGWLLLREEKSRNFLLTAYRNLPPAWARKVGRPLDDGISSLVGISGETLAIHGEPLKRFKVATLGQAAVVVPIKVQQEVIGLLVVVRKANKPFDRNTQTLLEAVADYASISLVNARLFRALQETAEAAQVGERRKREQLTHLRNELQSRIQATLYPLELLLGGKMGMVTSEQLQALESMRTTLQSMLQLIASESPSQPASELK